MDNQNVRLVVVFFIGIIVGAIAYGIIDKANEANNKPISLDSFNVASSTPIIEGDNGILVANQKAGNTVDVEQVVFARSGWVAIHDDVNGVPGRILGAKFFESGKSSGTVKLLRNTVAGTSYLAALHNDDGNPDDFSVKADTIMKESDGSPIMVKFTAGDTVSSTQVISPVINIQTNSKE